MEYRGLELFGDGVTTVHRGWHKLRRMFNWASWHSNLAHVIVGLESNVTQHTAVPGGGEITKTEKKNVSSKIKTNKNRTKCMSESCCLGEAHLSHRTELSDHISSIIHHHNKAPNKYRPTEKTTAASSSPFDFFKELKTVKNGEKRTWLMPGSLPCCEKNFSRKILLKSP